MTPIAPTFFFYLLAAFAIISAILVITRKNAVHSALALIVILYNRRESLDVTLWQDIREEGVPATPQSEEAEQAEPIEVTPGPESYPILTPSGIEPAHPVQPWLERRK